MAEDPIYLRVQPAVTSLLNRAAELAVREEVSEIMLRHVLRAMLFRPVTPALEQHLLRAAAVAEDANSSAVCDLHLLLAVSEDTESLGCQVLLHYADQAALLDQLKMQVRTFDEQVQMIDEMEV